MFRLRRPTGTKFGVYPQSTNLTDTAKAQIGEPADKLKDPEIGRFYWLGVVFPNGYFYQAGYMDYDIDSCNGFQTFTTRLTPNGDFVDPNNLYAPTHCGLTGQHWFRVAISSTTESTVTWQFYMDGDPIGPSLSFPNTVNNERFSRQSLATISENAAPYTLPADPKFPVTHYPNAIQVFTQGSWTDLGTGLYSTRRNNCTYRTLQLNSANDITTGRTRYLTNPSCYNQGDDVW